MLQYINARLANAGNKLEMKASVDSALKFLLIAGKPIGEPIVQHGPFVMNTQVNPFHPQCPLYPRRRCCRLGVGITALASFSTDSKGFRRIRRHASAPWSLLDSHHAFNWVIAECFVNMRTMKILNLKKLACTCGL